VNTPNDRPALPPQQPPPLRLPISRPTGTYILLAIIALVFVAMEVSGGSQNPTVLINFGANYGPLVSAGEYWRLFTANFLHIGLVHIFFNGYALYVLGQEAEAFYGHARFMVIFLLSSIAGALASFAFTYQLSAGASTGIVGLIGTLIAFFYRNRKVFGKIGTSRLNNLLFFGLINLVLGVTTPGIDNWGHAGGFIGGLILGWLLCPYYQVDQQLDGTRRVVDLNSLRAEWIGVMLFIILLMVAFYGALTLHPSPL
jgi:rhomboid protease GluP